MQCLEWAVMDHVRRAGAVVVVHCSKEIESCVGNAGFSMGIASQEKKSCKFYHNACFVWRLFRKHTHRYCVGQAQLIFGTSVDSRHCFLRKD